MNNLIFTGSLISKPVKVRSSANIPVVGGKPLFWAFKRLFDIGVSLLLLPVLVISAFILLIFNPFLNKGSLIFTQKRMGKNCASFTAIKFRSMTATKIIARGADDPIEEHRITTAGRFLRQSRIDELPQIINVLRGEMSLIGPRPDYFSHAKEYCETIPSYRARHTVRPGISGLAQVRLGYIEGTEGTRTKVSVDHEYIRNAGIAQDAMLVLKTIRCVLMRSGA